MSLPQRIQKLVEDGDKGFKDRQSLMYFWQEVALNFYPELSDFTTTRTLGEEFADHLTTSYPLLARRTLGNALSSLLRPAQLETGSPGVWFSMTLEDDEFETTESDRWLEHATKIMRRQMYDRRAMFTRATKESDHMFATFGQSVMSISLNRFRDGLMYRTWHLRDCWWSEDAEGSIDMIQRNWEPTITQLVNTFGKQVHPKVMEKLTTDPYGKVKCRHIVTTAERYQSRWHDGKVFREPWVSLWIDRDNEHVISEAGSWSRIYMIPRWVTIPGTQYAISPAITAALPDARLLQAMTLTMLETAEKVADPPFVAKAHVFKDGMDLIAGGVSVADVAYDQKVSDQFAPLYEPRAGEGMRAAGELMQLTERRISEAFFLDSLSLPPADVRDMTAFEVGQRISEWIRRAMPIFEPMEFEYNGELCEMTFDLLLRNGAFGSLMDAPPEIADNEIKFRFESPLHENNDRQRGQKLLEAKAVLMEMAELDPAAAMVLKPVEALRDVLKGLGLPSDWQLSEDEMEEAVEEQRQRQEMDEALAMAQVGGGAAKDLAAATKDFSEATVNQPPEQII